MGNRVFTILVLLGWGCSMTWLITAKILPAFLHGEPPSSPINPGREPVAWSIEVAGHEAGAAVTQTVPGVLETTEVHSRVMLERLPLPSMAPEWMSGLIGGLGDIRLDMATRTTFDSMKNLATFDTKVKLNNLPELVRMFGRVENGALRLRMQAGDFSRTAEYPWPEHALLGGELTPEPKLLGAYVGKAWTREVYSPFASPHDPVELLEAEVVEEERLSFDGELITTRRIEYRTTAVGVPAEERVRARLWVAEDGAVVRQEVRLMKTLLRFERLGSEEAQRLADAYLELDKRAALGDPDPPPTEDRRAPRGG